MWRQIAIGLFTILLLLKLVVVTTPRSIVVQIRTGIDWIGQPINWFEANLPWFSVIHFAIFLLLGLVAHFAFPRLGFVRLLFLLLALAIVGETVQWLVPGRNPGLADLAADVAGGLFGLSLVFLGMHIRRRFYATGGALLD